MWGRRICQGLVSGLVEEVIWFGGRSDRINISNGSRIIVYWTPAATTKRCRSEVCVSTNYAMAMRDALSQSEKAAHTYS
jgi:hypothetical protein